MPDNVAAIKKDSAKNLPKEISDGFLRNACNFTRKNSQCKIEK